MSNIKVQLACLLAWGKFTGRAAVHKLTCINSSTRHNQIGTQQSMCLKEDSACIRNDILPMSPAGASQPADASALERKLTRHIP